MSPFLAWVDFYARSRFARSTIPKEKWGTTRSLIFKMYIIETKLDFVFFNDKNLQRQGKFVGECDLHKTLILVGFNV